ncbi:hypothetical protein ACS3SW_05470 [Roseobacteraceae bacterium S113]
MLRLSSCVVGACVALLPVLAPVSAMAANPACDAFSDVAEKAVVERQADVEMMDAMVKIAEGYTGDETWIGGLVPAVVDWVWKLPEDQLDEDVKGASLEACEAFVANQ